MLEPAAPEIADAGWRRTFLDHAARMRAVGEANMRRVCADIQTAAESVFDCAAAQVRELRDAVAEEGAIWENAEMDEQSAAAAGGWRSAVLAQAQKTCDEAAAVVAGMLADGANHRATVARPWWSDWAGSMRAIAAGALAGEAALSPAGPPERAAWTEGESALAAATAQLEAEWRAQEARLSARISALTASLDRALAILRVAVAMRVSRFDRPATDPHA
jgi:hypothetical protein